MEKVYIGIIAGLILLCFYLFYKRKKQVKKFHEELQQQQVETASTIDQTIESHHGQIEELEKSLLAQQEADIKRRDVVYTEQLNKKEKYIKILESYSVNRGEVKAHNILLDLKKYLVNKKKISDDEMMILGNLFVPYWKNGDLYTRQIDHLVLLPTGIYVIETKYWAGTVLHGMTYKQEDDIFSPILEAMFSSTDLKKEQTIVVKRIVHRDSQRKADKDQTEIKLVSYGNPASQVMNTAIELKKLLVTYDKRFNFVNPIVYYGYPSNGDNRVINHSNYDKVSVSVEQEQLYHYFVNAVENEERKYKPADFIKIKQIIEDKNNIK